MCKICVDAVRENFPTLPDKDYGDFLFSNTAYPCGDAECVVEQIKDLKKDCMDKLHLFAYTVAGRQADEAMAKYETEKI